VKDKLKMELLAPAGTLNVFEKAVEAGADAVYIGAPYLNARALAKDFSMAEIGAMLDHAHKKNVKVYLAANSLIKETEVRPAAKTLALLAALKPDGLIIQDLGLYQLCKRFFPELRLHASTLLGAHNSLAVQQFAQMGFKRVVLARELPIKEISRIWQKTKVELEVFVHGALCFSYSGLCLFSSYLGGKSGLRGRCVQPCRRRYDWPGTSSKGGYFFSMNDLSAIDMLPQLQKAGVTSLKIEGRLRSAQYVASVVRAYRAVLDAPAGNQDAMGRAQEFLQEAMGRKTSHGFFRSVKDQQIISPQHSGNIGIHLGRVNKVAKNNRAVLSLREPIQLGDRLRLHQETTGERVAFTLRGLEKGGSKKAKVMRGDKVSVEVPAEVRKGDSLYKVDTRAGRMAEREQSTIRPSQFNKRIATLRHKTKGRTAEILRALGRVQDSSRKKAFRPPRVQKSRGRRLDIPSILIKIDDLQLLKTRWPVIPERLLVYLSRKTVNSFLKMRKNVKAHHRKLVWTLPPIINEDDIDYFNNAIDILVSKGFKTWQISHIGQCQFFKKMNDVRLIGNYTLNVLNSQSLLTLHSLGIKKVQAAIEIDRSSLADICSSMRSHKSHFDLGITVYGTPPLFTARAVAGHFKFDKPFQSPKREIFTLRKEWGGTIALAKEPFSLLSKLAELKEMGLDYAVIDLCHRKITRKEIEKIGRQLAGRAMRKRLSSFNYNGTLQ
jgi:putative protease